MADQSALIQLAIAVLGGGTLAAILNAIMSRKKLGADATKIITEAAAGVASDLRTDNQNLRTKISDLESRVDELEQREEAINLAHRRETAQWERERQDWRATLQLHAAWDHLAVTKLREIDDEAAELPEPPPLYPPYRVGA